MKTIKLQRVLYVVFCFSFLLMSCKKRPPGPHLESLSPEQGSTGTIVTIEGENLFYFEKAFFNDTEVEEEPKLLSNGERMELVVPDKVALGPGEVYLEYEDGRSNSLSFEVIDGTTGSNLPVISQLIPSTVLPGCELQIVGENLSSVTEVIFPVGLSGTILSQSATQLIIQVPEMATIGRMFLYTSTDTVHRDIVVDQGAVPMIDHILPASNDQGGPVIIYGSNLNLVNQIFFGATEQPVFDKTPTVLKFHVPVADEIKGKTVSLQLKTSQGCYSRAFDFEVGNGVSAQNPVGTNSLNITIPNTPGGITLPGINNDWKLIRQFWTDDPILDRLPLGTAYLSGADTIFLVDYGDTVATYVEDGTFLQVLYDGQLYFGGLDGTYQDFFPNDDIISPIRFVLTPLTFGDQIELIKPYLIEVGTSKKEDNTFTIKGRYFSTSNISDLKVRIFEGSPDEEIQLTENESVTFIDKTTVEFELQDTLPAGSYFLILEDTYEFDVIFSNAFPFEIN